MNRVELIKLAKDVTLMDELNTVSGLLEIDTPDNKVLIDSCINHILEIINKGENV